MDSATNNEILTAIIAGTILFLLFAGFIVAYIMIYWKRRSKHKNEVERMRAHFNEEILKSQLEIQEQTLNDISQEIHDNVGQVLSLVKVQVNIINERNVLDKEIVLSIKENLSKAITDLRSMARSMNTQRILNWNISEEISHEINRLNRIGDLSVELTIKGSERSVAEQKKLFLFRIFQESLQNIIRHSEASNMEVQIEYGENALLLEIWDNGKGFEPDDAEIMKNGLGLHSIRSRAQLVGGSANIESSPGKGTKITIDIPYE